MNWAVLAQIGLSTGTAPLIAQGFELSVDNVMRGPELVGRSPEGFAWRPDGSLLYFRWQQPGIDTALADYSVTPGAAPQRLTEAERDTALAGTARWSRDGRRALFTVDGDLVLWDRGRRRQLTETRTSEANPSWSADETEVFYVSGGNAFAMQLAGTRVRQLTDIRSGDAPEDDAAPEGQRAFLVDQQTELFEFLRDGRDDEYPWNRGGDRDTAPPLPFYAGSGKNVFGLTPTANGEWVAFNVNEPARDTRRVEMPIWVTDDGYTAVEETRTKVGDEQGTTRAAVLEVATGVVTFLADSITELPHDSRIVAVSPNSSHLLIRLETHNDEDRWYVVVDLPGLETRVVDHLHDDAWVGWGPGFYTAGFLPDGETVYFVSERTGWAHLYLVPAAGGEATPLTAGEWEVLDAELSRAGDTWYLSANRDGFADVHFYTMPQRGGELRRITSSPGRQDVTVSPDGRWLAVSHSESNLPWDLYFQRNRGGDELNRVTHSTTAEFDSFAWIRPEIVMIEARDGVAVPARIYRPQGDAAPLGERPAVVFVHGAGYLQNVHNWWSSYYREYMFHHVLTSHGYTVLDVDYRGSAGHGRDWRTAIYRHMGGVDLTDQVDAAAWLVENAGVDPGRIGLYGGSYGGFITLMALFTEPGVFQAGAALRPVTDWAHYNHGYTAAILNEPQEDSLAYRRSSPIYHAEGLVGHLLIAHGMVDDNVHFSDTARLAQRLIELGKQNWEVAMYPVERHGFTEISSWRDEYNRILRLFERSLR